MFTRYFSLLAFFLLLFSGLAQDRSLVTIEGFAPTYLGKDIEAFRFEDMVTMKTSKVGSAQVRADSTFKMSFFQDKIERIVLKAGTNTAFMYVQPNGKYDVYFPDKDRYDPYRPAGNKVELTFFGLDTMDVNYRILRFNRWMDNTISDYFYIKIKDPTLYNTKVSEFKENVEKFYIADTGTYLYDYIRYSIASMDNAQQAGNRTMYEKYDFYLGYSPVLYENDAYMHYFNAFYKNFFRSLPMEMNNKVYLAVLKSSPSGVMNAIAQNYTMSNYRIRELVMIKSLGEEYFGNDFPQTNILTILDSLSEKTLFPEHQIIAKNLRERLTEVMPGSKAPELALKDVTGETKLLSDYQNKYVYLHFFDPTSDKNKIELPLLKKMYAQYNNDVEFITIIKEQDYSDKDLEVIKELEWDVLSANESNPIWKNYKIESMPYYVLIDPYSYVVQAPALSPQPNGEYMTIDHTFFQIQKMRKQQGN